jgi:uncharacterized protein (TIGR03083 family)
MSDMADSTATLTSESSTILTPERYLASIRADGDRIVQVAPLGLDQEIEQCPGWSVRDALEHTGGVFSHKVVAMRDGRPTDTEQWEHGPAAGGDPVAWFRDRLDELVTELEQRGADETTWTWHEPNQTVGFWYRRIAQETAVHRVDVESGVDAVTPIDHDVALDGIDELLDWFLAYQGDDPDRAGGETVAIRTGQHIWRVTLGAEVALVREPGSADALVSGEPSELLLWLWGRRPESAVTIEGEPAAVAALRRRLDDVTQ